VDACVTVLGVWKWIELRGENFRMPVTPEKGEASRRELCILQ